MASPSELVEQSFANASSYAAAADAKLTTFTNAMDALIYTPPTISLTWSSISPPSLPALPTLPTLPTIAFSAPSVPSALVLDAPTLTVDTFSEVAPTTAFPTAPTLSYGSTPTIPTVATITVPTAPTLTTPTTPTYLSLSTPTFAGINIHEDYLANLTNVPTLVLAAPTPYSYALGAEYASSLLTAIKATLLTRIAGGTGLDPTVEAAIWSRARDRETQLALSNEAEIARTSDALGFHLPAGVLAAQLREAQQEYYDKLSTLSRDVAIKQADLEQANLKDTIAAGMELEGKLIDYSFRLEQLTFESAKTTAENAIASYNAQVENYKALLSGFQTYAVAYRAIIDGELAKVEAYKAQIEGERAKADTNRTLVEQYKAEIEASLAVVEVFKAQVSGAQTLVQIEQTKIAAAGEQVKAYVAQINAETAKIEAYKAGISAENTKVEVYRTKATAYTALVGAQAEVARIELARYTGLTQAKTAEYDGYRARVDAERARLTALGVQSNAQLDSYRAGAAATEATANLNVGIWRTQIAEYEAGQQATVQTAKINGDFALAANAARLDAAKVGAQVYAQLTSSAYSIVHANAQVSGQSGTSVQYSYSNDTTSSPGPLTSI